VNWTTRLRVLYAVLFTVSILTALVGWLVLSRDVTDIDSVLMWGAAAVGIGEGSNVGKRATFKKEAVDAQG